MHRFVGRVVILSVNVHAFGYRKFNFGYHGKSPGTDLNVLYTVYKWLIAKTFQESIAKPANYWGLIALICMDCLFFFSTALWRQKAYNIFLLTHIPSVILLLPATVYHKEACLNWVIATVVIYALDVLLRLVSTRLTTATVRAIPELSLTRVEMPSIRKGWKAGQHVRLRVISGGMGLFGWTEIHPFTIASVSNAPGGEGMVLLCKKAGGWTNKLYDIARGGQSRPSSLGISSFAEFNDRKVTVMIEGPYGGPGHRIFASFSAAVFVCGGSGITFGLSSIRELIAQDLAGRSRVKVIELIWSIQDPSALVPMIPELTAIVQDSVFTPVRISVFYTRAPTGKFPFTDEFFKSTRLTLSPGRPKVSKHLEETIQKTLAPGMNNSTFDFGHPNAGGARSEMGLSGPGRKDLEAMNKNGLLVGVCGPQGLADSVFTEVNKVDSTRRDQVGGIEVHEETFGW
jgi:ferric-chelate reductase